MRVTSSRRVRPSAANAVVAPATKNAPAPASSTSHREGATSTGQNGALSLRLDRHATIANNGGSANHNRHVVNTSASEWPARTNNDVPDHKTTAMTTAMTARRSTGIARDRLAMSTTDEPRMLRGVFQRFLRLRNIPLRARRL